MVRATDAAAAALREAILRGDAAPGSRLGETELAEQLGLSRTPVREALRQLASDGLVTVLPNRGARVAEWSREDLEEIYELRALLEAHAAARAATRIPDEQVALLVKLCDEMDDCARQATASDLDRIAELNARFHGLILEASGSARLTGLMKAVVQVPLVLRTFHHYSPEALRRSLGHHREIVAAFRAGDADWASSVMRSHVLAARAVLLQNLPTPEGDLP